LYGYKFGDLSKGLAKKAASAINEMTGKETYEVSSISAPFHATGKFASMPNIVPISFPLLVRRRLSTFR
jgi:hypothetical protein